VCPLVVDLEHPHLLDAKPGKSHGFSVNFADQQRPARLAQRQHADHSPAHQRHAHARIRHARHGRLYHDLLRQLSADERSPFGADHYDRAPARHYAALRRTRRELRN
jgi:hypothetical protein